MPNWNDFYSSCECMWIWNEIKQLVEENKQLKEQLLWNEEITMLVWQIKEYREELLKISPKNNSYEHMKNEIAYMEKRIDEIRYLKEQHKKWYVWNFTK